MGPGPDPERGTRLNPCSVPALGRGRSALAWHGCRRSRQPGVRRHGTGSRDQCPERGPGGEARLQEEEEGEEWRLPGSPGAPGAVFLAGAATGWRRRLEKSAAWPLDGHALLPSPCRGQSRCLDGRMASGPWGGGMARGPDTASHCALATGAAGSRPRGTGWAQGLLGSVSLTLSSWESPQCPSQELQLCWGRGGSQTESIIRGCVLGGCCGELGGDEPSSGSSDGACE